jgi:hypothetical protein
MIVKSSQAWPVIVYLLKKFILKVKYAVSTNVVERNQSRCKQQQVAESLHV